MRGVYNLNPNKVGQVQDLALLDSKFGAEPTENWHGVDITVNARLRNGLTIQAGTSTGRTLQDNCALRSALPETYPWSTITVTQIAARRLDGGTDQTRTAGSSSRS